MKTTPAVRAARDARDAYFATLRAYFHLEKAIRHALQEMPQGMDLKDMRIRLTSPYPRGVPFYSIDSASHIEDLEYKRIEAPQYKRIEPYNPPSPTEEIIILGDAYKTLFEAERAKEIKRRALLTKKENK